MGFRFLSKSEKLHDLEQWRVFCVISPNSVAFGADYVKVVEDRPILSAVKLPKNLVCSDISFIAIFAQVTENE